MKTLKLIIAALTLIIITSSCRHGKHVTIVNDDNGVKTELEYSGKIAFSDDSKSIVSMSPNSYIKFESKGQTLIAERSNEAPVTYQLNDGDKSTTLTDAGKTLISEVLQKVAKTGSKSY